MAAHCTEIQFIEPGVKVNGAYYRDNLLAKKLLTDIFRKSLGWVLSFNRTHRPGASSRDTVAFLKRKVPDFVSPTLWSPNSPDLNPDDYIIWSVGLMQEKVYRSRIATELEMRVIDEWGRFDLSIVDSATAANGAVVSALVYEEWGTL